MDRARLIAVLGPHAADFLAGVGGEAEDLTEDRIEALRAPPAPPPFLHHGDPYKDRPGILRRVGQLLSAPSVQAVLAGLDEDMEGSQRVRLYRGVRGLVRALAAAPERSVEQLRGLWETALAAVPGSRRVQAGTGLTGGGPLTGDVTLSLSGEVVSGSRQVLAGTGLTGGGALSSDVTLTHATSGVTANTYASPSSVTVDARGHITAITAGSGGGGLGDTWSSGPLTFGGPTTLMNLPTPPSSGGGLYWVRVITGVQGRRITLQDAQGATVGQTEYQPGGGDGPDGSERVFRRGAASANVPNQVEISDAGNGLVIEIFRP